MQNSVFVNYTGILWSSWFLLFWPLGQIFFFIIIIVILNQDLTLTRLGN